MTPRSRRLWRCSGKDDQAPLVPFHLPVRADGHLRDDERVSQRREYHGRCGRVPVRWFSPEVSVRTRSECEVFHALREGERGGKIQRRE